MPLPTPGSEWPPREHQPAYQAFRDWDAWYSGDSDKLRTVYMNRGQTGAGYDQTSRNRPSQYAGGIIGRLSRFLWGAPTPHGQPDRRLHVPVAGRIASAGGDLLFAEPPKLTAPEGATAAQERLDVLLGDGFARQLRGAAAVGSALGGVYLRPIIDQEIAPGRALLSVQHADSAVPVLRNGRLVEVAFHAEIDRDERNGVLRLVEHHEPGWIVYRLYRGDDTRIGEPIPLDRHPTTAALARDTGVDSSGAQPTGLPILDVVYVQNDDEQRRWRSDATLRYLGRSDYDGSEPLLDQFDAAWTSWMTDIRLARGRIVAPAWALETGGPGQPATFDPDREVYSALRAMGDPKDGIDKMLTPIQFEIRWEAHKRSCEALLEEILHSAGYNTSTFGESPEGGGEAITATEVHSRQRFTFVTRDKKIGLWRPAMADYLELHLAVEQHHFSGPEPVRPTVEFADSVSEAAETLAKIAQTLAAAESASIETRVRRVNPDWDDTQVGQEVAKIYAETGRGVVDPDKFTGA